MGKMEEIRERAKAEAELLPPTMALLKLTQVQVNDLHKQFNDLAERLDQLHQLQQAQAAQLEKLLRMTNAIGLLVKKQQQPQPRKKKWTFWIS